MAEYSKLVAVLFVVAGLQSPAFADISRGMDAYRDGDLGTALTELAVAAHQGDAEAQDIVGLIYADQRGGSYKPEEAVEWFLKAAEQGNADAQFNLGTLYEYGRGVAQSNRDAASWYRKAAVQGVVGAQHKLAAFYERGQGVAQSYQEAANWYRKPVELVYAEALRFDGLASDNQHDGQDGATSSRKTIGQQPGKSQGSIGVSQGNQGGEDAFRKLAEQGNAVMQDVEGDLDSESQSFGEAANWYRKAADQGYAKAQESLGLLYQKGLGVPQSYQDAASLYLKAAEQGDVNAQSNLGALYRKGLGVPQNYSRAADWFQKAADQGDGVALYAMGVMYARGEGVPKSYRVAESWFRKAAIRGNAIACQYNFAVCDRNLQQGAISEIELDLTGN
jgi:uncharacterized protein